MSQVILGVVMRGMIVMSGRRSGYMLAIGRMRMEVRVVGVGVLGIRR
jgi:hypothetical protein